MSLETENHRVHETLESAKRWYEGHRSKSGKVNTNAMTVGIAVAELLKSNYPLTDDVVKSRNQGQVKGLSRTLVSRILAEHGETQEFTSEGGRTSRGSLVLALELASILNDTLGLNVAESTRTATAIALQDYFVSCIQADYSSKQRLRVSIDWQKPVSAIAFDILEAARHRADQPTGAVAQHLAGAKLELRFPNLEIGRDQANAADQQTNRQGDFQVGSTAFHVTVAPSSKLVARASENIAQGYRPVVLVPHDKMQFASGLFASEGMGNRVGTQSIESFVGTNVEEMGGYDAKGIRLEIAHLVRRYNMRIKDCESDKSLMLIEPEWITSLLRKETKVERIYEMISFEVPSGS